MKREVGTLGLILTMLVSAQAQVDTSYIYNTSRPYGTLDIRIAKSATRYYYLQENRTFSFRESGGNRTNTFIDMTSWNSGEYTQGNLREKSGSADYFILNYRLLFPVNYQKSYSSGYPLIIMMHGAGERGNCWSNACYHDDRSWNPNTNEPPAPTTATSRLLNNDHNLLHGGRVHLDARNLAGSRLPHDPSMPGRAFPGFILFPQNLNGWNSASVQDAIRLIRLVVKKYNIDEDRIYIHGLSNGGSAVYDCLKRAPWLFAAALPMSSPTDASITSQNLTATVTHIPLWIFQGGNDTSPSPVRTETYIKKFRDAGAFVRYSLYQELGHGTWNRAYSEPDFFSWILSKNKSTIHVFGGSKSICLTNKQGVRMDLARGFKAYQWERNGVMISGATSASYVANTTGVYRARFSRVANPGSGQWNQWSASVTVTQQTPPQAQVEQIGTVLLKDLNAYGNARLKAKNESAHYYWYKNGALVNLNGNQDDTTRHPLFYPGTCSGSCTGNGKYTLVTAGPDGCPSPPSAPKYVYFNNQAPLNISAPTNFAGQLTSASTVKLTWRDASTNEGGFEIWRRKANGTTYTKWEMRILTGSNVQSFVDTGLDPSAQYHYKIRAVANSGRSNYTPSASNAFLIINTGGDNIRPGTPQSLTAAQTGISTIQLAWTASTDNSGIKQYRIYYDSRIISTNSASTSYTLSNLSLNTIYTFTVRAEDLGSNLSDPSNAATASTYVTGLYYEHSTGAWTDLDQINWLAEPEVKGKVNNFTLTPRTQDDFFNFEFHGYLYISSAGAYKFRTISSDGSRLQINNTVMVNNDGIHGNKTITSASYSLASGAQKINVKYFEYDGSHSLIVQYYGPDTGFTWKTIPDGALNSGEPPAASTSLASTDARTATEVLPLDINVFPNPTTFDNINIEASTPESAPLEIKVIDLTGRSVYGKSFRKDELDGPIQIIPRERLPKGLYFLIAIQGDNSTKSRIYIRE